MKKDEFARNTFGTRIKKCCASCKHKTLDKGKRICNYGERRVEPCSVCEEWEMASSLLQAGAGGGRVKKMRYLMFMLNYPQPEKKIDHISIAEIRREYKEKYGTIYEDI